MRATLLLLALVICLTTYHHVHADFLYNRVTPNNEELEALGLVCIPGRTVIRVQEKQVKYEKITSSEEDDYVATDGRRSHMNFPPKDESCQVCVCSVEGKDEYCSKRPAMNVNECMRMATLMHQFEKNVPYEHERNLANRIRRDYLWHKDEIPYEPRARCQRGSAYYSNSVNANDTDIDIASEIESLLDYSNRDICYYCVCSVQGHHAGCISRNPWFCEYFRTIREGGAARDMYNQLLQQDRPTYFRQLSHRLRRTMDAGMYDLVETVGASDQFKQKCVPFVSEYSDCTDDNQCSGCSMCACAANATWVCEKVNRCMELLQSPPVNEKDVDAALMMIENNMKQQRISKIRSSRSPFVPEPTTEDSLLIDYTTKKRLPSIQEEIMDLLRPKRSVDMPRVNRNSTIKFYHTVDEVNEDTLKNNNASGTLKAGKHAVDIPKLSRRAGGLLADNTSNPLHIEYNKADIYQHINDNKIDAPHHQQEIHDVLTNYSQKQKDRDISKVIVREMKSGTEIIGDKKAPIMSNVSFTPENETFVAMTYIAGNLLNKLWNMETESSETIETEVLKHEKIAELLDLFKEPLSINQEMLLKNAMEQLSVVIDKNKDIQNVSLCEQLGEAKEILNSGNLSPEKKSKDCDKDKVKNIEVVSNVNNVVNLVKKLEDIESHMDILRASNDKVKSTDLKAQNELSRIAVNANSTMNMFGGMLDVMSKLLLPAKNAKRFSTKLHNLGMFGKDYDFKNRFKNIFNIALGNITMTTKDKIILDYLTHIQNSPDCLLRPKKPKAKPKATPNIERNILLNLSEFFKIKSLTDLVHLLGPEMTVNKTKSKKDKASIFRTSDSATETVTETFTKPTLMENNDSKKLTATKEKLKAHLKTILEDLVELQNAKGASKNSGIKLTDVLPCIYNILNADKKIDQTDKDDSIDKLESIFGNLKRELKYASYRRSNTAMERPKSAIVWERVIKNLNKKQKNTRRSMNEMPAKSINELKKAMDDLESQSNTYKNVAILSNVPPAEKLTLLKTLDFDVKKYIETLESIKKSLEAGIISSDKTAEFNEFVDNVANNININGKVIKKINRPKFRSAFVENIDRLNTPYNPSTKREFILPKDPIAINTKITRDQVINQLIKNRITLYVGIKEAKGTDLNDDINYDIAKRILMYLEGGNNVLARELYNIFANRQKKLDVAQDDIPGSTKININKYSGQAGIFDKEPLVQFEEPKTRRVNLPSQNHLIQQLINMKNMGA